MANTPFDTGHRSARTDDPRRTVSRETQRISRLECITGKAVRDLIVAKSSLRRDPQWTPLILQVAGTSVSPPAWNRAVYELVSLPVEVVWTWSGNPRRCRLERMPPHRSNRASYSPRFVIRRGYGFQRGPSAVWKEVHPSKPPPVP